MAIGTRADGIWPAPRAGRDAGHVRRRHPGGGAQPGRRYDQERRPRRVRRGVGLVAPGNGLVDRRRQQRAPGRRRPKRLAEAVTDAGGTVHQFESPKASAWRAGSAEAANAASTLGAGRREGTRRAGRRVRDSRTTWSAHQTRSASTELDKLALHRGDAPIPPTMSAWSPRRSPGRCARSPTRSVSGGSSARGAPRARGREDARTGPPRRAPSPRPELLEIGDRVGAANGCPRRPRPRGSPASSGCETLARRREPWTVAELTGALDGLLELDAMVKHARARRPRAAAPGVHALGDGPPPRPRPARRELTRQTTRGRRRTRPVPGGRDRSR